jgi:beta-glucanase (GH16 family)
MKTTINKILAIFSFIVLFFMAFSCSTDANNIINPEAEEIAEESNDDGDDSTNTTTDTTSTTDTTMDTADTNDTECPDLVWSDEFEGTSLDEEKWSYQRGGWNGSNVQNCYVDENTTVSDGVLKITAKYEPGYDCFNDSKDFTSGFVQTKDRVNWTYGYFEAKVKVPASNSTWPAFWMSPQEATYGPWPQSGEIDIFEIKGHDLTKSYGNAHWGNSAEDRR